ncbi:MAG TPA: trigger factor [Paludibacter sp.]|nr:trigger factor [Paludibacter sp.]
MNIVRKDLDQNNVVLTLRVEKTDYAEKVEKTLRDYRKKANVPGFRPGMVPASLVQKMYGKSIVAEEVNKLLSDELYKYIRENNINLLGEPLPSEDEQNFVDFNTQETFEFSFDLGIAPQFEVELNKKDKVNFYNITVSDEMIENQLKSYTGRYGKYVQEEVIEEKDMVKGELLELVDGKVNESGIKLSDAVLTPGYMKDDSQKAIFVGANKGDVVVFNPSQAFDNDAELASLLKVSKDDVKNITSDFRFTIEGVTRYHESEINQELFDKVYGEGVVNSEEDFRAKIKENIQENLVQDSNYKLGTDVREMLVKKYDDLTFPDTFLKRWLLATNKNISEEKIEEDFSGMIAELKWQLIKDKIGKTNDIKVENEDIEGYAKNIAKAQFAQYGMIGLDDEMLMNYAKDMLKKEDTVKSIFEKVYESKVVEIVKNNIKLDVKELTIEEFNKMFEN